MKVILGVVVAIVIVLLAINYFTTGKLSLIPPSAAGGEQQQLAHLRSEFRDLAKEYRQAQRQAAIAGLDTTEAAAAILAEIDAVEENVSSLAANGPSEEVRSEAKTLLEEVRKYKRDLQ
jgi:hypothetical protein